MHESKFMLWRDYRERRGSATSMDIQPKRREKKKKTQTFYPSPQSFSEADQYEYSSEDEDDDSSYDGDFKKTLVSPLLSTGMSHQRNAQGMIKHTTIFFLPHG